VFFFCMQFFILLIFAMSLGDNNNMTKEDRTIICSTWANPI